MSKFRLHYWVSNGGDGSANVCFAENAEQAESEDEEQSEGWGESSASYEDIYIDEIGPYFLDVDYLYNPETKKSTRVEKKVYLQKVD